MRRLVSSVFLMAMEENQRHNIGNNTNPTSISSADNLVAFLEKQIKDASLESVGLKYDIEVDSHT